MLSQSMAEVRVLEVEKKLEILLRENAEKRLEKEEAARANLSIELKAKDETIKILTNLKCNQTSIFFGLFKKKTCY